MEQGAFDNLPGAGKPLPNLGQEYDPLWWVKQLAQREQLSMLPPSLELLRKVERELATIEKLPDEATVRRRIAALNVEIAKVNATVVEGPPTRLGTLDVDQVVARWRRTRSPLLGSSSGASSLERGPPGPLMAGSAPLQWRSIGCVIDKDAPRSGALPAKTKRSAVR